MPSPPRPPDSRRPDDIQDLVSEAQRHAQARDSAYAQPSDRAERPWTRWALALALPVLALVVLWNVRVMGAQTVPPPDVEAVDLARTLRVAVDEIETFREENGRLPDVDEAEDFLPVGTRLVRLEDGYELVLPAPVVEELRYRSEENPDRWLSTIRAALEPGGAA